MNQNHPLFDPVARHRSLQRANALAQAGGDGLFLIRDVGQRLLERLEDITRSFQAAADIGGRLTPLGAGLRGAHPGAAGQPALTAAVPSTTPIPIPQSEVLPTSEALYDLALSHLCLHAVNDLPGLLIQINRALKPDGLLLASLFGGETLADLRTALLRAEAEVTGGARQRVLPMADVRDCGGLLQRAGFAMPVADVDSIEVSYDSALTLMRDLRGMGETNCLTSRASLRRDVLFRAAELYTQHSADSSGRIRARFDVIFLCGWRPHQDQPKPLKPGSGKVSLASVLGTTPAEK